MTNLITLTIPNDDHIALRAFSKALEEMALAHGAEPVAETLVRQRAGDVEVEYLTRNAVAAKCGLTIEELDNVVTKAEVDTTAQQVESLCKETNHVSYTPPTTDSTGTPWDERIHSTSKALNADGTWRLRRKPKDMDELEWSDYVSMIKADLQYPVECGGEKEGSAGGDSEFVVDPYDTYEEGELPPVVTVEPPVTPPGDDFHTDENVVSEQTVAGIPPLPVPPQLGGSGDRSFQSAPHKLVGSGDDLSSGGVAGIPPVAPPAVVVAPPVNIGIYQGGAGTIGSGSTGVEPTWDFPRLMTFLTERHGKIDVATVNTLLAQDGMLSVQELNAHPDKIGPFVARVKAHLGE